MKVLTLAVYNAINRALDNETVGFILFCVFGITIYILLGV